MGADEYANDVFTSGPMGFGNLQSAGKYSYYVTYVTTDPKHGALRQMATEEGYESFIIPPNVGGRYSVLTAVGPYSA